MNKGPQSIDNQTIQGEKYLWLLPGAVNNDVLDLAASYNVSTPIIQTLVGRGISSKEAIDSYLFAMCKHNYLQKLFLFCNYFLICYLL